MATIVTSDFRTAIAERIAVSHHVLAARWLDELKKLVPVAPDDIFPGDRLLGQIPALIEELAASLRVPAHESIAANAVVTARAAELGKLRHAQRASVHQVLREYRRLRRVIADFIDEEMTHFQLTPTGHEVVELMNRLESAIDALLQTTVDTFVAEFTETITQHTARLEGVTRMMTHELRQPLGIFQFAVTRLQDEETWRDHARREQLLATADRNVTRMTDTLGKLVAFARSPEVAGSALAQPVDLAAMVSDVAGQLQEMADARDVDVRVASALPSVTIDAARLELVLVNLISNAIKYCDPDKPVRVVEITSVPSARHGVSVVSVRDNGIGIAETDLSSIFARFYRVRPERDGAQGTNGLGLGLSIVADCVDALKGEIRVESTLGEGTTFFVELPWVAQA